MSLVKSMTGYGRAVETVNGREFTVELRSVNNRYLDCTVKLPRSLSFGEDAVKQAVKNTISRGKVDVFLSVRSEGAADVKVTLNESMVAGYLAAMKQMAENFDVKEDISVSLLSRMPDVFTVEKPEVDEQQLLDDMLSVVNKALAGFDAMRTTEGKALENDLRSRGQTILSLVSQVEAGGAQTVLDYRTRLENKLKEVLASTAIDESRILTEAAIFADKVAVDEETVRLRSHLEQMNNMLTTGAGLSAAGNEPGGQHHRLQVHQCASGTGRGGDQGRAGKDPGADPEHRVRSSYEACEHRFRQHGRRGAGACHCSAGLRTHQAGDSGGERPGNAH